ncbi:hypothetical protein [Streptomyces sp. NPDC092370]
MTVAGLVRRPARRYGGERGPHGLTVRGRTDAQGRTVHDRE